MKKIFMTALIFMSLFSFPQEGEMMLKSISNLSRMFGTSSFGCDWSPGMGDENVDGLSDTILSTPNGGGYSSLFDNWFEESYGIKTQDKALLLIGISNKVCKIYVFKGALEPRLIAILTYNLDADFENTYLDKKHTLSLTYTKYGDKYLYNKNTSIINEMDNIPNLLNYELLYDSRFIDIHILKSISISFNPITLLDRKSDAFLKLSNKLNTRLKI